MQGPAKAITPAAISRRRFLGAGAGLVGALVLRGLAWGRLDRTAEPPLFGISLAEWSLHRTIFGGDLDHLDFARVARDRYGVGVEIYFPDAASVEAMVRRHGQNLFYESVEARQLCCGVRKVAPLARALDGSRPFEAPAAPRSRKLPARAVRDTRRAVFERAVEARVIERAELAPGHHFEGPALVEEYSGTTVVPPGWTARITAGCHLLLTPRQKYGV